MSKNNTFTPEQRKSKEKCAQLKYGFDKWLKKRFETETNYDGLTFANVWEDDYKDINRNAYIEAHLGFKYDVEMNGFWVDFEIETEKILEIYDGKNGLFFTSETNLPEIRTKFVTTCNEIISELNDEYAKLADIPYWSMRNAANNFVTEKPVKQEVKKTVVVFNEAFGVEAEAEFDKIFPTNKTLGIYQNANN